jgi:hypothetical protein
MIAMAKNPKTTNTIIRIIVVLFDSSLELCFKKCKLLDSHKTVKDLIYTVLNNLSSF